MEFSSLHLQFLQRILLQFCNDITRRNAAKILHLVIVGTSEFGLSSFPRNPKKVDRLLTGFLGRRQVHMEICPDYFYAPEPDALHKIF